MANKLNLENIGKSVDVVGAITNIGATTASAITQIQDSKKRQAFQNALMFLSQDKKRELDTQLKNADNEVQRIAILSQALTNLQAQRISQLSTSIVDEEKKKRTNSIIFAGGVIAVGGILVLLILKYK
jgi:parvulin-like peptidyl-prolyl isomerase